MHYNQRIYDTKSSFVNTNNIVVYVNENTFYEILKLYYFDSVNQTWDQSVYNTYIKNSLDETIVEYTFNISFEILHSDTILKNSFNIKSSWAELFYEDFNTWNNLSDIYEQYSSIYYFIYYAINDISKIMYDNNLYKRGINTYIYKYQDDKGFINYNKGTYADLGISNQDISFGAKNTSAALFSNYNETANAIFLTQIFLDI